MKKYFILITLLIGLVSITFCQTVDSIKVEQAGEFIKIHYKILNSNQYQTFRITLYCSINNGLKSELKSLVGDFGENVIGGKSEYIVMWDVLKDVDEVNSVDFSVRAELVKDDTPITKTSNKDEWSKKRIHAILAGGQVQDKATVGIRLAYMGSWGITGKYLIRNMEDNKEETTTLFHTGLGLTKRIVNKGGFSMHLLAGFNYGKYYTNNFDNSTTTSTTYELGTIIAYKRLVISFAFSQYEGNFFANPGIGIRF